MANNNIKVINIKSLKPDASFSGGDFDDDPAAHDPSSSASSSHSQGGQNVTVSKMDDFLGDANSTHNSSRREENIEFFSDKHSDSLSYDGGDQDDYDQEQEADDYDQEQDENADEGDDMVGDEFLEEQGANEEEEEEFAEEQEEFRFLEGGKKQEKDSDSVVQELSGDPMFLVMSHFLTSKSGKNLVDILESINENLTHFSLKTRKANNN